MITICLIVCSVCMVAVVFLLAKIDGHLYDIARWTAFIGGRMRPYLWSERGLKAERTGADHDSRAA
jgi:hypothetical protein